MTIQFLYFLILLSQPAQNEQVTFETINFFNSEFLSDEAWEGIPVNHYAGEDVNSERYGGVNYPPVTTQQLVESRLTIARGNLEVGLELKNLTSKTWLIERIELIVEHQYLLRSTMETGTWDVGSRTNGFHPIFQIEENQKKIIQLVDEEELLPEEDFQDTYYIFEVSTEHLGGDAIYEFSFDVILSKVGGEKETVVVFSDRHYFITPK